MNRDKLIKQVIKGKKSPKHLTMEEIVKVEHILMMKQLKKKMKHNPMVFFEVEKGLVN
jgi:phage gp16-like protein